MLLDPPGRAIPYGIAGSGNNLSCTQLTQLECSDADIPGFAHALLRFIDAVTQKHPNAGIIPTGDFNGLNHHALVSFFH